MNVRKVLIHVAEFALVGLVLTVAGYAVLSLFFSTDVERRLQRENRMYERMYSTLLPEEQLIGDVITGLQIKDSGIYEEVFQAEAPNADPVGNLGFLSGSDTIPDSKLVSYTSAKADVLEAVAGRVDDAFSRILYAVADPGITLPPMDIPLKDITYSQIGAGQGMKINPFYKSEARHNGLDFIAPQGAPVFASGPGVVVRTSRSSKGRGREVVIGHQGSYQTRYAHLSEVTVTEGQRVRRGQMIGRVGMTGSASSPHLHYEVMRDTLFLNPINYIFASVKPDEYLNMIFMSANTRQSMD